MTIEKAIKMITEYIAEPNYVNKEWVECLLLCKNILQEKQKKNENKMKVVLDKGAILPTRAHDTDAGLDLYAKEQQIVLARESAVFDTGVHIELPPNTTGFLKSKSGLNVNHGITNEGVIDVGYTGSIKVKLYNNSGYDYIVEKGDKISQLVILPIVTPEIDIVESLEETERGNQGFGSSGK